MSINMPDKEVLRRLVSHDSTSTKSNLPIAEFVCDYLDRPGISVSRHYSTDMTKVNVLARVGPEPDASRAGLVLCGHLDVVPATEPEWETDPFRLEEKDGNWYGRGTCDMKGFNALAMNAFTQLDKRLVKKPLMVLFTYDEELGSLGAQRFAESWPRDQSLPKSVLIGEPTSLQAVRMHKGHLKLRITLRGTSAHSGSPHLGENAIEPAGPILAALSDLREVLESERTKASEHFPAAPFAVLNIARIAGGVALNVIPDQCIIEIGVRLLPGQQSKPMIKRITTAVKNAAGDSAVEIDIINDNPPMLLEEEAEINRDLCSIIEQKESHGVSFASDAGMLQRDLGLECVLYGPGAIELAHRPNEFVPIVEMQEAKRTIEQLVRRMCVD